MFVHEVVLVFLTLAGTACLMIGVGFILSSESHDPPWIIFIGLSALIFMVDYYYATAFRPVFELSSAMYLGGGLLFTLGTLAWITHTNVVEYIRTHTSSHGAQVFFYTEVILV